MTRSDNNRRTGFPGFKAAAGLAVCAALCCFPFRAAAQTVLYIYDPARNAIVSAGNESSLKQFEEIGNLKKKVIANKEKTAANYMVMNVLEEYLYLQEKSLTNGNLSNMMNLYNTAVEDIKEFWEEYEKTYVLSNDTLAEKCQAYYERAKKKSDYEMDQIKRRVDKYVKGAGFIANNNERILMMENCYDRVKAEKMRVVYHGRVLFSLAVYREGYKDQQLDVLKKLMEK